MCRSVSPFQTNLSARRRFQFSRPAPRPFPFSQAASSLSLGRAAGAFFSPALFLSLSLEERKRGGKVSVGGRAFRSFVASKRIFSLLPVCLFVCLWPPTTPTLPSGHVSFDLFLSCSTAVGRPFRLVLDALPPFFKPQQVFLRPRASRVRRDDAAGNENKHAFCSGKVETGAGKFKEH